MSNRSHGGTFYSANIPTQYTFCIYWLNPKRLFISSKTRFSHLRALHRESNFDGVFSDTLFALPVDDLFSLTDHRMDRQIPDRRHQDRVRRKLIISEDFLPLYSSCIWWFKPEWLHTFFDIRSYLIWSTRGPNRDSGYRKCLRLRVVQFCTREPNRDWGYRKYRRLRVVKFCTRRPNRDWDEIPEQHLS